MARAARRAKNVGRKLLNQTEYRDKLRQLRKQLIQDYRQQVHDRYSAPSEAFIEFSGGSADGNLTNSQYNQSLTMLGLELSDGQHKTLQKALDKDQNKQISRAEWDAFFATEEQGAGAGAEASEVTKSHGERGEGPAGAGAAQQHDEL